MALTLYDTMKPSGNFVLIEAQHVGMENGMRLEEFLKALAENAGELDIDYEAHVAFDTTELVVGVTDEPDEPVVPDEPDDTETTPAILGVAILGRTILGQY